MKITMNPRLRSLLLACFTGIILSTAGSLYGETITTKLTNDTSYTVEADTIYTGVSSTDPGGAILNGGVKGDDSAAHLTIEAGAQFIANEVEVTSTNGADQTGGAIFNSATLIIEDATSAENATIFSGNTTTRGGAIYQYSLGSLYIGDYTQFTNNTSTSSGSVIHARGGFTIGDHVTFDGNTASSWGAAIYTYIASSPTVPTPTNAAAAIGNNVTFSNNKGGGIFHSVNTMSIGDNASFTKNSGISYGAAIYNTGSLSLGTNATFEGNSVNTSTSKEGVKTSSGGAIVNNGIMTIDSGASFSNNKSEMLGGAIVNSGTMTITNATFTANEASMLGGAILNAGELTYTVTESITNEGNTAAGGGGFLYANADSKTTFDIVGSATLTIGNGTDVADSIASADSTASIVKTGTGTMEIQSSMAGYLGSLDVLQGTMTIAGELGASEIKVAAGATLTSANYSISSDTQGNVEAKEGVAESYVSKDTILGMTFAGAEADFGSASLHLNNSDIAKSTVSASEILVTGKSSITASTLNLKENATIALSADANLTLCESTAALILEKKYPLTTTGSTTLTYTASTWSGTAAAAQPATFSMTRSGEEPSTPHYDYSATNSTLTGVAVDGMNVLTTDALTLRLEMPDDFDPSTGFTFNFELEGVSGVAEGFNVSNIIVIMGDGQFGGKITGINDTGANLVLVGEIVPEPSTATLSLLALAGLLARRRRKS